MMIVVIVMGSYHYDCAYMVMGFYNNDNDGCGDGSYSNNDDDDNDI